MRAELVGVKIQTRIQNSIDNDVLHAPAFPLNGGALLQRLTAAVAAARGFPLSGVEVATITGQPETTISYWRRSQELPHLVAWCCLLEQLPAKDRHRFVDGLCRELPSLEHPWLAHDPVAATRLAALLARRRGITLVSGGDARQRTFLLAALGHTSTRLHPRHRPPSGMDAEEPTWFVPLPSIHYLRSSLLPEQARRLVTNLWPAIRDSDAHLVLLNGVWSMVPELREDILQHATRSHVVLADASRNQESFSGVASDFTRRVEVAASPENRLWIQAKIS